MGIYKEQNRMRQDNSRTPGNRQNGLGIHQEFRNEPGVHKEWWGSVKFWLYPPFWIWGCSNTLIQECNDGLSVIEKAALIVFFGSHHMEVDMYIALQEE